MTLNSFENNTIIITYDEESDMLKIESSNENLHGGFEGNVWDFEGCGYTFKELFDNLKIPCQLILKKYDEWYK